MDPCPVLVGRHRELSALHALLDTGGGVAIVSGEAGIGKSRLVREFAAIASERGRLELWARPEEVAQPGPYALIVDLLVSLSERGDRTVKVDARTLSAELARSESEGQRPAPNPRAVAAEVRGLIAQLGRPPLIVLEDLHWADEASHSVVLHLARAARDDEHVYVATLRPEGATSEASLGRLLESLVRDRVATEIAVGPLAVDEMATMLEIIWGRPAGADELSQLTRLGEGVPFFIEELATAEPDAERARIPRSVEQSVAARMRSLGEEASRVVTTASLIAGSLDVAVISLACDVAESRVADHLAAATHAGLLADAEGRLVFRHSLVRDAIAAGLVSVEAAQTHGRLAAAIEKVHAGELDPFAAELARHHRLAGETQPAIEYSIRAGERALAFAATEDARTAFTTALDLSGGEAIDAMRGLAEVEFRDGNEAEASRLFRAAADELKRGGESRGAAIALGRLAWTLQGRVDSSLPLRALDEGLALLAGEEESVEYAKLMIQKGGMLTFVLNRHREAKPILERVVELATALGNADLGAEALDGLAQVADGLGFGQHGIELGRRAITLASESKSPEVVGRAHNNHALLLAHFGKPKEGLRVLAEGRRRLSETHGRAAVAALDITHAWIGMMMGLPAEVAGLAARGAAAWHRWLGYRRLLEVWATVEQGELDLAQILVDAAWQDLGGARVRQLHRASPISYSSDISQVLRAEALLLLARGPADEALGTAIALVETDKRGSERIDLCHSVAILTRAYLQVGDQDAASQGCDELRALLASHPYNYPRALLLELSGLLAVARGDSIDAVRLLEEAAAEFELCENVLDRTRCYRTAAELTIATQPDRSEVGATLRTARDLASSVGAAAETNRIEAIMRSIGLRPRAGRPRGTRDSLGPGGLSNREAEIVALVAAGSTNAEIARQLFLSERTVQDHITHSLRKLGLPSRAGLASWAVRQGMV